ncbi:MAG TPA: ABC transporter substrate-binding protein [Chloroflexota bacterium]|nr:ABC transporter substrate-binding protein [Chloroflexota bacterium]
MLRVAALLSVLAVLIGGCASQAPIGPPTVASGPTTPPTAASAAPTQPLAIPTPAAQSMVRLKVGHLPAINSGGLYVAFERGYFREQGLDIDLQPAGSLTDAAPLIATGEIAVYGGGTGLPLYNAVLRGIPIKAIADKSHEEPGYPFKAAVARKDLYDSGVIRSVADLKGHKVGGLNSPGTQYQLDVMLRTAGLRLEDVNYVGFPGLPEGFTALSNGVVDASFTFEPFLTRSKDIGAVPLMTMDEAKPGLQGGVINYGTRLLQDRDLGNRFMVAYVKGIRTYLDALGGKDRDGVISVLQKYSGISDRDVYERSVWGALYPDGHVNADSILDEEQWYVNRGDMPRLIPLSELVDDGFSKYAAQSLGPYQKP